MHSFSPPCEFTRLMHSFSPPCELIRLMHSFFTTVWTYQAHALFFTTVWTYQTHALFFHHRVNLWSSCTLFFTTVRTYQTHGLLFHHRVNLSGSCILFQTAGIPTCILHMQEHCGSTEQSGRYLEILQRRKLCGTETLLGLLVWVRFQIKSIFIIHRYAKHKYYHSRELLQLYIFFLKQN